MSPNNASWTTGAAVDLPDHPAVNISIGQWATQQEFPGKYGGFGINYFGPISGGELAGFFYYAPSNIYQNLGGTLLPPYAVQVGGTTRHDFFADTRGTYGDILIGCLPGCGNKFQRVLSASETGTGHFDSLILDETVGQWQLTTNNGAFSYFFRKDGFGQPTSVTRAAAYSRYAKLNFNSSRVLKK